MRVNVKKREKGERREIEREREAVRERDREVACGDDEERGRESWI